MKANTAFGFRPIGFTMKSAFADRLGEFKECLSLVFGFSWSGKKIHEITQKRHEQINSAFHIFRDRLTR